MSQPESAMKKEPRIKRAARYLGVTWMMVIALVGVGLVGSGLMRGSRGTIYVLFGAAIPGVLAYKWGARETLPTFTEVAQRRRRAPIELAKGDSHSEAG